MPPPSDLDVAALLYLNPELAARVGVHSVESALQNYDALCAGRPYTLPPLPPGFDADVYLASRPAPSEANATVRLAVAAEAGLVPLGEFVGTMMRPADLDMTAAAAGCTFRVTLAAGELASDVLSPGRVRTGDEVRAVPVSQSSPGGSFEGTVTSVDTENGTLTLLNPCRAAEPGGYTLVGIRVADARRQALAELAHDPASAGAGVIDPEFDDDLYRAAYPEARLLNRRDAFLDRAARWARGESYRLQGGRDVVNARAPVVGLTGALGIGMSNMPGPSTGGSASTRLAVDGDVFTTGTVITLSDARTKSGLERITGALERVRGLHGYTFLAPLREEGRRHTGLLAHEVHAALPEAVYEGADGVQAVAYGNLAGLLAEAINALADRVDALGGPPH